MNMKSSEKILTKREHLWSRRITNENDESMKNKKALTYLLNKTKKTAITNHPTLIFTVCNIIFFG